MSRFYGSLCIGVKPVRGSKAPDVVKYLFRGSAAGAAASVGCRSVHKVADCVEADGGTARRGRGLVIVADVDHRQTVRTRHRASALCTVTKLDNQSTSRRAGRHYGPSSGPVTLARACHETRHRRPVKVARQPSKNIDRSREYSLIVICLLRNCVIFVAMTSANIKQYQTVKKNACCY